MLISYLGFYMHIYELMSTRDITTVYVHNVTQLLVEVDILVQGHIEY